MAKLDLRFNETKEQIIEIANALQECQLTNRAIAVLVKDSQKSLSIKDIETVLDEIPRLVEKYFKK